MELIVPLGIALIVAGWAYSDAKERDSSSPTLWAIGVFAILIIFLPLYFFMRPSKNRTTALLCPHCGRYYNGSPIFCPNCGKEINDKIGKCENITGLSKPQSSTINNYTHRDDGY